jgi:hypothetical protein
MTGRERLPQDGGQDPVLPDQTGDDTDEGWSQPEQDDDERLQRERPPHWE